MRMLFVADLHYGLKQFDWLIANAPGFDAVLIGGDLLDLSSALDLETQIVVVEKYLSRISHNAPLLVSSGNHDGDARNAAQESICRWLHEAKAGQLHVDGESVVLGDTLVTICPWWDGPQTRAEVERLLERDAARPKQKWIWIHHAPPAGSPVCWTGRKSAGDEILAGWIPRFAPDFVLSGHIHNAPFYPDGSWIDRIGKTWVFNVGRQIGPQPSFVILDFEAMKARWISTDEDVTRDLTAPVAGAAGA
ncbi:MAG: metallophosphoesterase [Akkermansiaceae bacterium]|nr:metallophosphoesterase [Akkermansiaceae bacterium]MCU0778354.1 metallophosphoesterase [Akkermansiaceae bacterium]